MSKRYDAVYYWKGGRETGEWRRAMLEVWPEYLTMDAMRIRLSRAGFIAHCGNTSVGPPDGPPADSEFRAIGV